MTSRGPAGPGAGDRHAVNAARAIRTAGAGWPSDPGPRSARWFALLTEKQLRRGVHRSTRELEAAIDRYLTAYKEAPKPFVWTKVADEILASIAH
jgi:hypothetical protein